MAWIEGRDYTRFEKETENFVRRRKRDKREAQLGEDKREWCEDSIYVGFLITVMSLLAVCGIAQFIKLLIFTN